MKQQMAGAKRISRRNLLQASAATASVVVAAHVEPAFRRSPSHRSAQAKASDGPELSFALSIDDAQALRPLLDEYTRRTGVRIRTLPFSNATLFTNLSIALLQGTAAYDIVSMDDMWLPALAGSQSLVDLTDAGADADMPIDSDFIPALLNIGTPIPEQGARALPWRGDLQVFGWRSDVLTSLGLRPPETWHETLHTATEIRRAMGDSGLHGFCLSAASGVPAARGFLPVLRGFGIDVLDPTTNEPLLGSEEALRAIDLYVALAGLAPAGIDRMGAPEIEHSLSTGSSAMAADIWHGQLSQLMNPALSGAAGLVEVGRQPAEPGIRRGVVAGCWLLGVPSGGPNVERAVDLVMWLTRARRQKELLLTANVLPTRASVYLDPEAIAFAPYLPSIVNAARSASPRPRTPYYAEIEEILGQYVASAIAGTIQSDLAMVLASAEIRTLLIAQGVLD